MGEFVNSFLIKDDLLLDVDGNWDNLIPEEELGWEDPDPLGVRLDLRGEGPEFMGVRKYIKLWGVWGEIWGVHVFTLSVTENLFDCKLFLRSLAASRSDSEKLRTVLLRPTFRVI